MREKAASRPPTGGHRAPSSLPAGGLALVRVYLQTGAYEEATDLARRILSDCDQADLTEAQILLAEGCRLRGRQSEARSIRSQIEAPSDPELAAELDLFDVSLLAEEGRFADCVLGFGAGADKAASFKAEIRTQFVVAQSLARMNQIEASRRVLHWAMGEAERFDWPEGMADAVMSLGLLDRMEGQWARSEEFIFRARELYRRGGHCLKLAQASLNLGVLRLQRGRLRMSEAELREAVILARELGDFRVETSARTAYGLALLRLGRIDDSRKELAIALRLSRQQASPRRKAIALEYAGELHLRCGRYSRARANLERALRIARRSSPGDDVAPGVLRRLAEVELGLGHAVEALRMAVDAEMKAASQSDRLEQATALRVIASARHHLGEEDKARADLERSLRMLEDLGEQFERDRTLGLLRLLRSASDTGERNGSFVEPVTGSAPDSIAEVQGTESAEKALADIMSQVGVIGRSPGLLAVFRKAQRAASSRLSVLILGETGTGKDLLARSIHALSPWACGPLVSFSCATCPRELIDAEFFGSLPGAYTGARSARLGMVRAADGGTLFLDEIGELPLESQGRLLRFLDSGETRPLGSDRTFRVRVRILSATNSELEELVRRGRFRADLYFRLAQVRVVLPSLRERREDIPLLVEHFLLEAKENGFFHCPRPTGRALQAMRRYDWPGNVRQLRNEILGLAAMADHAGVLEEWAPPEAKLRVGRKTSRRPTPTGAELALLLDRADMTAEEAAQRLGVSRATFYRILAQVRHGVDPLDLPDPK